MTQVVHLLDALGLFLVAPSRGWERESKEHGFLAPVFFVLFLSLAASVVQAAWLFNGTAGWSWGAGWLARLVPTFSRGTLPGKLASLFLTVLLGTSLAFLDAALLRLSFRTVMPRGESSSAYEPYLRLVAFSFTATLWTVFTAPFMVVAGRGRGWTLVSMFFVGVPGLVWRVALLVKGAQVLFGMRRAVSIEATLIYLVLDYSVKWTLGLLALVLFTLLQAR